MQNRTAVLLLADQTRMKPYRNDQFFSSFFLTNKNKQTAGRWDQKDEEEPTGTRGMTEGSPVRETGVTYLTLASLPALRRLKRGKQQKMRRRDTPLTTHGETLTYTLVY